MGKLWLRDGKGFCDEGTAGRLFQRGFQRFFRSGGAERERLERGNGNPECVAEAGSETAEAGGSAECKKTHQKL